MPNNQPTSILIKILIGIGVAVACAVAVLVMLVANAFRDRRPPIYFAAERGNTNQILQYLASGADINKAVLCYPAGRRHASLLHIAVEGGQLDTVGFLLNKGANPNQPDWEGNTPLVKAICRGQDEVGLRILKSLLKAGGDPNLKDSSKYGWTPLIWAADLKEPEMVKTLLDAGAHVGTTNSEGLTAIHFAGSAEVARILINAGADPRGRAGGETPAESAVRLGHIDALVVLTNAPFETNGTGSKVGN